MKHNLRTELHIIIVWTKISKKASQNHPVKSNNQITKQVNPQKSNKEGQLVCEELWFRNV